MVISPQEAEKVTQKEADIVSRLEPELDNHLRERYSDCSYGSIIFSYEKCNGLRSGTLEKFLDQYRQVGWNVKIEHDQRDGSFISFTSKKSEGGRYS